MTEIQFARLHTPSNTSSKAPYSSKKDIFLSKEDLINCCIVITKTRLFRYIEISSPKTENFQIKNSDIFHISAQNIDCGYSLEYSQSMFLSRNKKNIAPDILYKSGV